MSVTYREIEGTDVVEIEVDGAIDRAAFDDIAGRLERAIARHRKLRLLEVISSFGGIDAGTLIEDIRFSLRHLNAFSRVAVVTDLAWLKPLARIAGTLSAARVEVFPLDQLEQARRWLREEPGERPS